MSNKDTDHKDYSELLKFENIQVTHEPNIEPTPEPIPPHSTSGLSNGGIITICCTATAAIIFTIAIVSFAKINKMCCFKEQVIYTD